MCRQASNYLLPVRPRSVTLWETLGKMKKGTAANFIVYEAPGLGVPMKISLEGFSAGLDSLITQ